MLSDLKFIIDSVMESSGRDINFNGDVDEVKEWLHKNIQYHTLSESGRSGFDQFNFAVFGIYRTDNKVFLKNDDDAAMFLLKWG